MRAVVARLSGSLTTVPSCSTLMTVPCSMRWKATFGFAGAILRRSMARAITGLACALALLFQLVCAAGRFAT